MLEPTLATSQANAGYGRGYRGIRQLSQPGQPPFQYLNNGPGGGRFSDYIKIGLPLIILILVIVIVVLPFVWPF